MRKPVQLKNFVIGAAMIAGCAFVTAPAQAEDLWPCEVALCIANPAGPMAVSECVAPIKKLYRHLAKGRSFPMCKSADGHVQFTRYGMELQEDCPAGTRTVYRNNDEGRSFGRNMRMCEKFVPTNGGFYSGDNEQFEYRIIDGKRVYGQVVTEAAPVRQKPRYLDYVVQGDSRRLWW
ncbi:hypothetical protein RMS29_028200 (plasmid) [Agrobacterium rosae]|uniref:Conjugal transfer protein TrbM n=1 Tax=Agrobacterium rosae TaxID=1972867 RepID=A0ABU4W4J7_9HYPH|nr:MULTISPECIES: hypothetical protein [Agrobacterium]MDX8311702.1 hypothetical protein [Agrobacterium sp. rho-13.3]MDX8332690.1 hypothetical protein [Agrobacterium rosae]